MADTNRNKETASYESRWQFDSAAWMNRLDVKSDQILSAIKELSDTYQYASYRFSAATDFAQKLRELSSNGLNQNSTDEFERCCQDYGHRIEEVLNVMSRTLRNIVR